MFYVKTYFVFVIKPSFRIWGKKRQPILCNNNMYFNFLKNDDKEVVTVNDNRYRPIIKFCYLT